MPEHDSSMGQTAGGWCWSCRTCLAQSLHDTRAEARTARRAHDARPLPWWADRLTDPWKPDTEEDRTDGRH